MHALIEIVRTLLGAEEDVNLSTFFSVMFTALKTAIWGDISDAFLTFLDNSRNFFISIGHDFCNVIAKGGGLEFFTDNFLYFVCGTFIGIFLLKYVVSAVIEFISKLLDPM